MKKRVLLVLPTLSLLASCGGSDPLDEVRKNLPDDVQVVNPSEEEPGVIEEYVSDAFEGVLNISEERAVYHLSIDVSFSINGKIEDTSFNGSSRIKGDLFLGYETIVDKNQHPYSSLFVKLSGFTVQSNISLPADIKEELPIPDSFGLNNVDLYAYAFETEEGTFAYLDMSNHELQDYVKTTLLLNEMDQEDIDEMLDSILGEKIEGSKYRPGLSMVDVSALLQEISDIRVQEGADGIEEEEIMQPITTILDFGQEMVVDLQSEISDMVEEFLPMVSPVVGVKYSEAGQEMVGLDKTSIAINVSSEQIAAAMEIPPEYMPVNGVAGLLVSVGMDKGSEDYALEELNLSANISASLEDIYFSFNGSLVLTATYNEQARLVVLTEDEMKDYNPITDELTELILSLM